MKIEDDFVVMFISNNIILFFSECHGGWTLNVDTGFDRFCLGVMSVTDILLFFIYWL